MSDVAKFFDAAHRLAQRVMRSLPPETTSVMLTEICDVSMLELMARVEHQELVKKSKNTFRELRSLEWIVLHSGDYRIPGVIALPLKIYSEESGEEDTYDTYYAAAAALGMEKEHVSW